METSVENYFAVTRSVLQSIASALTEPLGTGRL
eukprot:SAG11_NODE_28842_length_317_cov_0.715596_1_plen_32_part_10